MESNKPVCPRERWLICFYYSSWSKDLECSPELSRWMSCHFCSVQFIHSVVPNSLWPHVLKHPRLPCPSPAPGAYSDSCPSSWWCHPPSRPLLFPPSIFPSIRVFSSESVLHIRWPKYWSFSFNISPSNEHPGLISIRIDWLDLLAVQGTLKSLF